MSAPAGGGELVLSVVRAALEQSETGCVFVGVIHFLVS